MSYDNVHIFDRNDLLAEKLGFQLEEIIQDLMSKKSLITIGLSGGSLIDILASVLPRLQFPWARLRFFFVDERFVSFTSDDSTFSSYQQKLFRQLPLTEKNIVKIDPSLSIEEATKEYQTKLEAILHEDQQHSFDILLLGMGPDGHTASLFPHHSALKIDQGLVTYLEDSPKPPPGRLTLTLNTINQAKHKIVVATGQSKADIVKEVVCDKSQQYPIGLIHHLIWYLDEAAASKL